MKKIDITGNRYGRLTVIKEHGKRGKNIMWLCRCDCGKEIEAIAYNLKNGHTRSCGCLQAEIRLASRTTHNQSKSRLYRIWRHIKSRCFNSKVLHFKHYGGRGICMCAEWEKSFESFMSWSVNNGYANNLSIDRIDVNGDYTPDNCRWTDAKMQANNKTNNRVIEYKGKKHTLSEWADIVGLSPITISKRIDDYRWTIERALGTPLRRRIPTDTVLCACGCGAVIRKYDKGGRERRYVSGHNLNLKSVRLRF